MNLVKNIVFVALFALFALVVAPAYAQKGASVPSCCVGGNCCAKGVCCVMPGCCKADKSCCDPKTGVCTSACGCLKNNCCASGKKVVVTTAAKKQIAVVKSVTIVKKAATCANCRKAK